MNGLAGDMRGQLNGKCKNFVACAVAIYDYKEVKVTAQFAVFICGVNEGRLQLVPMKK